MNVSKQIIRLGQQSVRYSSSSDKIHPGYFRLKEIQKKFQQNDGKPVHLKGGVSDVILYRLTMGLCIFGVGASLKFLYELSFPKPAE